jgi:hypothetical protein
MNRRSFFGFMGVAPLAAVLPGNEATAVESRARVTIDVMAPSQQEVRDLVRWAADTAIARYDERRRFGAESREYQAMKA